MYFLLFTLIQAVGTRFADKINRKFGWRKCLFSSSLGIASVFVLLTLPFNYNIVLAVLVAGLSFGIFYTVNSVALNKHISSENRASTLSLQHAITKIAQMFVFAVLGLSVKAIDLRNIFLIYGIVLIIILVAIYKLYDIYEVENTKFGTETQY